MKKLIAVTIGDINGIGIEILLDIWKTRKYNNFILITNNNILKKYLNKKKINIKIKIINKYFKKNHLIGDKKFLNVYNIQAKNNNENTYNSLIKSYELVKLNYCKGVLNLPLNKEKIINNINKKFIGQTELYMKLDKKKNANMMFIFNKIKFISLTTHISLNNVNKNLSKKNYIYQKLILLNKTLINDFKISSPKIIITGINPHAGEMGTIGKEEIKLIAPVIKKLKIKNLFIEGPVSADSIVTKENIKKYDCIIFNYHDQALIPFKILSQNRGINFTSGLNIIRVSPDHGTGYNIVGKKIAKIDSILNCFKFINKIYINRKNIVNS